VADKIHRIMLTAIKFIAMAVVNLVINLSTTVMALLKLVLVD